MNWFTYDFFDPQLPSDKWQSNNASPVPQYIQDLAVDLPERVAIIRCNDWNTCDYIGGIKIFESRTCVFRVCNGGRDSRGRPHRWVLLVAENELSKWRSLDILTALESPVFKQYSAVPVPSPAPFPASVPEWQPSVMINSSPLPDKQNIQGTDAERQIRDASVSMTSAMAQNAILIVENQKSKFQAWFQKKSLPPPLTKVAEITEAPLKIQQPKPQEKATTTLYQGRFQFVSE